MTRRLTWTERFADWLVDGRYTHALDLSREAVQEAACRPLRAQLEHDVADTDEYPIRLRPATLGGRHRWHD